MSESVREDFDSGSYEETEEYKRHERVMERIRCMSSEEKLQTLVDAGIVNEDGELTQRYGGSAPNRDD
jgi:hypothetical protein